MATIRVQHTIGDLAADCARIANTARPKLAQVVRRDAEEGNRIARAFASQQHTMGTDIDVPYHASFSAEARGQLSWEYGPEDDGVKHGGSQATGYELGSRNQPPHLDLARSVDIIGPKFAKDVGDTVDGMFW
jgi:hypothetical protein